MHRRVQAIYRGKQAVHLNVQDIFRDEQAVHRQELAVYSALQAVHRQVQAVHRQVQVVHRDEPVVCCGYPATRRGKALRGERARLPPLSGQRKMVPVGQDGACMLGGEKWGYRNSVAPTTVALIVVNAGIR